MQITREFIEEQKQWSRTRYTPDQVLPALEKLEAIGAQLQALQDRALACRDYYISNFVDAAYAPTEVLNVLGDFILWSVGGYDRKNVHEVFPLSVWKKDIKEAKRLITHYEPLVYSAEWIVFMDADSGVR